ncbi:MAG: 3-hydroxyacyl-ACP dehydratase FabZ [Oscillospiraceae bacterium]|jgi:3-hydroxyacyl-[acyl-carrier-protein] dehydratase|nr:3-hydroxyacyl-ACP dehydratase FabZ [Oscillospiraceae bacterium]
MTLTSDQIREILPHRYPFLLIDRVEDYEPGKWARALKCVTQNEPFFPGHFPKMSVMPGVLVLEALAQTGAIFLLTEPENRGKIALFGGVKEARFRAPVTPGDVLRLECVLVRRHGSIGVGEAVAMVGEKKVCTAELTFAIIDENG